MPGIIYAIYTLLALIITYALAAALFHRLRRWRLLQIPLPDSAMSIIRATLPPWPKMPGALQRQLLDRVRFFIADKTFEGCGGLSITDEIKYTIAAQACLLLLNPGLACYPKLHTILVYATAYRDNHRHLINSDEQDRRTKLGESWQGGSVVLAWDHVVAGITNYEDGHNVTFHEFAHQLDQDDGSADGTPRLPLSSYATWARVFTREYRELIDDVKKGRRTVLDAYGTENPAEFFAVATEAFFEKPRQLRSKHPQLYAELRDFFCVDPIQWL